MRRVEVCCERTLYWMVMGTNKGEYPAGTLLTYVIWSCMSYCTRTVLPSMM